MQDLFFGKVIKTEIMKKIKVDDFPIDSGEEVFYTIQMYFYTKKYLAIKTSAVYYFNANIDRYSTISELSLPSIKKMCEIRYEQLKRNIEFLKSVNYNHLYKQQCLEKLFLSKILNDIFHIEKLEERQEAFECFNKYFNLQISSDLCKE
jgi:hypothetical protein